MLGWGSSGRRFKSYHPVKKTRRRQPRGLPEWAGKCCRERECPACQLLSRDCVTVVPVARTTKMRRNDWVTTIAPIRDWVRPGHVVGIGEGLVAGRAGRSAGGLPFAFLGSGALQDGVEQSVVSACACSACRRAGQHLQKQGADERRGDRVEVGLGEKFCFVGGTA